MTETFMGSAVLAEVYFERQRQIDREGFTHEHDDNHDPGELAAAAAGYVTNAACLLHPENGTPIDRAEDLPVAWPWESSWWKPKGARRDLIRAAALIVAEIERIDRQGPK